MGDKRNDWIKYSGQIVSFPEKYIKKSNNNKPHSKNYTLRI